MILDDIIARTSGLVSGTTGSAFQDPFADPFDVNSTALHGLGMMPQQGGADPYSLDVFSDFGIGQPWWWDTPAGPTITGDVQTHKAPLGAPTGPFDASKWMDQYGRGQAPYSALVSLGPNNLPSTNGQWYLRPDTAAAFTAMDEAFHAQTGEHLTKYLVSAYRNFGTPYETSRGMDWHDSDHASGGALDVRPGSAADQFISQHGAQFGFGDDGNGANWGDPGHHSFTAGGFHGWYSSYSGPSAADQQWIAAAGGQGGTVVTQAPMNPLETFLPPRPAISQDRLLALVPEAQNAGGITPPYQMALPSAVAMMLAPEPPAPRRRRTPTTTPGGRLPHPKGLDNVDANRNLAEQMAAARGWTGADWMAIRYIVEGHGGVSAESSWLGSAKNPTLPDAITAYGIGQRLIRAHPWLSDAEKQKYLTNVAYQIQWMFNYIAERYGSPTAAWAYKVAHNNY